MKVDRGFIKLEHDLGPANLATWSWLSVLMGSRGLSNSVGVVFLQCPVRLEEELEQPYLS
jgi:hypothetical protein